MPSEQMRYDLAPDAVLQFADSEALVVKLEAEEMYALNDTGTVIVQHLADGTPLGAVIDDLAATYALDRGDVARDVTALVASLVERGLLVERGGAPR